MNNQAIKQLTTKYSKKEIVMAVKVLNDVLNLPGNKHSFRGVDIDKELTKKEIAQLKRLQKNRLSGKANYVSAKKVWNDLGL